MSRCEAMCHLAVALLLLRSPPVLAGSADEGLDALMAALAQRHHGEADYRQEQYLSVLQRPLESAGELLYDAPDHLEQRTLVPRRQSLVLDHGMLTIDDGKRSRTLPLAQMPQIAPLIDSIRATLAGDRTALEHTFELRFSGTLEHWQLQLAPRATAPQANLAQITLQGTGDAIREVTLQQRDGDRSLMHITPRE
jgi:hypothetical protein